MPIRKFLPKDFAALSYELNEVQRNFTATVQFCINERKDLENPDFLPLTILFENLPVGFFVLDFSRKVEEISGKSNSVLLRSLSLNPIFQGKGIAKKAMKELEEFLEINFPDIDKVVLAVNFDNENAYQLYLKCGFQNTGKTRDGRSGKQFILAKNL